MNRGHLGLAVLVVFLAQHAGERGTGLAEVVDDVYRAEVMVGGRWSSVWTLGPPVPTPGGPSSLARALAQALQALQAL